MTSLFVFGKTYAKIHIRNKIWENDITNCEKQTRLKLVNRLDSSVWKYDKNINEKSISLIAISETENKWFFMQENEILSVAFASEKCILSSFLKSASINGDFLIADEKNSEKFISCLPGADFQIFDYSKPLLL